MEAVFRDNFSIDWAICICILALLILLAAKKNSEYKFSFFAKLFLTNTYLKTYKNDSLIKSFHMLIISFMAVVFPLIPQALLFRLGIINQISIFDYVKIGGAFLSFFLIKTVLQIIFGVFVKKKEAVNRYLFEKQTYFSYLIFISLFPLMFLLFCPQTVVLWVYLFVFVWIMLFVLAMLLIMSRFKELILEHPLYFILYLCAFEICPIISAFYIIK